MTAGSLPSYSCLLWVLHTSDNISFLGRCTQDCFYTSENLCVIYLTPAFNMNQNPQRWNTELCSEKEITKFRKLKWSTLALGDKSPPYISRLSSEPPCYRLNPDCPRQSACLSTCSPIVALSRGHGNKSEVVTRGGPLKIIAYLCFKKERCHLGLLAN